MPSERKRTGEYESQGRASLGLGKDVGTLHKLGRRFKASYSQVARAALRLAWRHPNDFFDALEEVRDAR